MSLIANKSYPHLSPPLPHLATTPTSPCHYASTYLPLHPTQPITTPAPICHYSQLNLPLHPTQPITTPALTCKHLSHSFFPTHAFHASRPCLSTFENMLFLPIEHALLVPWRGPSPTHLITFWFHVVYELHNRRLYTPILRIISSLPCSDFSHTSSSLSSEVTLCVIGRPKGIWSLTPSPSPIISRPVGVTSHTTPLSIRRAAGGEASVVSVCRRPSVGSKYAPKSSVNSVSSVREKTPLYERKNSPDFLSAA